MEIKVKDKFYYTSPYLRDCIIEVIEISNWRPSELKYAVYLYEPNGILWDDVLFLGEQFFKNNEMNLKRIN